MLFFFFFKIAPKKFFFILKFRDRQQNVQQVRGGEKLMTAPNLTPHEHFSAFSAHYPNIYAIRLVHRHGTYDGNIKICRHGHGGVFKKKNKRLRIIFYFGCCAFLFALQLKQKMSRQKKKQKNFFFVLFLLKKSFHFNKKKKQIQLFDQSWKKKI